MKEHEVRHNYQLNNHSIWRPQVYPNIFLQLISYYLFASLAYGVFVAFSQYCCESWSLLHFLSSIKHCLKELLFGLHLWMWNHMPENLRLPGSLTVLLYFFLITLAVYIYSLVYDQGEQSNLLENFSSVTLGILFAHVPIRLITLQSDFTSEGLLLLNLIFMNIVTIFIASFYFLLRIYRLPFSNIKLNQLLLSMGFVTGLIFNLLYGTANFPFTSTALISSPSVLNFIFNIVMPFIFAMMLTMIFFKLTGIQKRYGSTQNNQKDDEKIIERLLDD